MQLLRFDSRRPNPRYSEMIDSLAERMAFVPVVASTPLAEPVVYADNVSESRSQVAA